jgi:ribosomal protein S18 acetylase RimI-like enzyme
MSEVVIRELEQGDVEAAVAIAVAAWEPIYAQFRQILGDDLFAAAYPDCLTEKARQVRKACEPDSRAMVAVAEKEGEVVGFITYYAGVRPGIGEIGNNAVRPDQRGQGIGPTMYRHALDRMRALGMRFAKVGTGLDPSHAPARRAYEKAGFDIQLPSVTYYRKL